MTTNREQTKRGAAQRAPQDEQEHLDRRRADMHAAEGHAGSIPRGAQRPERKIMSSHRIEWERVLGH